MGVDTGSIYFPFLRGKRGEAEAAGSLAPRTRLITWPTFDLSLPRKDENLEQHVCGLVQSIASCWGTTAAVGIDVSRFGLEVVTAVGDLAVQHAFDCARQCKLQAVPIARALYLAEPPYLDAIRAIVARDKRGAILRLSIDEFRDEDQFPKTVDDLMTRLGLEDSDVVMVLDVGPLSTLPVGEQSERFLISTLRSALSAFAGRSFRHVVFAGSSVPERITRHADGRPHLVARTEMSVWRQVAAAVDRLIAFGDYGSRFAHQTDPNGVVVPPSRVHLATGSAYYLYRAKQPEHRDLCGRVVQTAEFLAQPDCWGKSALRDCGIGVGDIGTPKDWVARDTNMHIEVTASNAATFLQGIGRFSEPASLPKHSPWLQVRIDGFG